LNNIIKNHSLLKRENIVKAEQKIDKIGSSKKKPKPLINNNLG